MPYVKSKARRLFESEVDSIICSIKKAFLSKGIDNNLREYVLGHAVILTSAKIEDYTQDIFTGYFANLNKVQIISRSIPKELRAFLFHNDSLLSCYKNYSISNDEKKLLHSLGKNINALEFNFMIDSNKIPYIDARKIYKDVKYPSPDNMVQLYRRTGIYNIFHSINKSARSDMKIILESFNDVRTELAHGGKLVGRNDKDIIRLLRSVKKIILHLDRVFSKHTTSISSASLWPT